MFRGVNNINIDVKGRFGVPSRFREFLANHCSGEMVVTIDTEEKCLLIYPRPDWDDIQRRVEELPSFNAVTRRVQRLLIGHATDVQMDASGRVLLSPPLRTYANLEKKGILIGQGKKWSFGMKVLGTINAIFGLKRAKASEYLRSWRDCLL